MNIITIGDLHGSQSWKQVHPKSWDRIVFTGDYVDSYDYTDKQILLNFQQVLLLKKDNPEKVILLLGNHDLHYFFKGTDRHYCTGFRRKMLPALHKIFQTEKENFQAAFQVGNHLWTHAGVVQRWYDHFIKSQILPEDENVASTLNRLFLSYYLPLFHVSEIRGGYDKDGGIFWAHSTETCNDPLPEYHQIVGHTRTQKGILIASFQKADTSFAYVDCLESREEFYKLDL
jgi:predicted MPP superfamily phosphohydrolase